MTFSFYRWLKVGPPWRYLSTTGPWDHYRHKKTHQLWSVFRRGAGYQPLDPSWCGPGSKVTGPIGVTYTLEENLFSRTLKETNVTEQRLNLGDRVKDSITGFTGIYVCRLEYLHGCVRISIQPEELDKDGKPPEDKVFDEGQVELVEPGVRAPVQRNLPRPPGGPDRGEARTMLRSDPRRTRA